MQFLGKKLRGLRQYSVFEISLVPLALVLLGLARAAILIMPFKLYAPLLGRRQNSADDDFSVTERQRSLARSIGRAVRATAAITPWSAVCLPQAMAAAALLRMAGVPFTARLGLAPGARDPRAEPMQAHAWLKTGDLVVTGGPINPVYKVVASFAFGTRR